MSEEAKTEIVKPQVFLGIPNRGELCSRILPPVMQASKLGQVKTIKLHISSLLNHAFNMLYAEALNKRKAEGITHFCLLHSDIVPEDLWWMDILLEEKARVGADIISVVMPLKGRSGVTSCGVYDNGRIRRFTMTEINTKLPKTFDAQAAGIEGKILLANTGILLFDVTKPWSEDICFTCQDQMARKPDGTFEARVFSEDWNFSHWAATRGLKVFNTSLIKASHVGNYDYRNSEVWGIETEEPK